MYNILVTGSNGQLGKSIRDLSINYTYNFFFTTKEELDISLKDNIETFCKDNKITHIINCSAYTNVDEAEDNIELAHRVNHIGVKNLANISKIMNINLIHISTDYVFDGKNYKPYIESDIVNPIGVYGKSKLDGEKSLIDINPKNSIIIRTSWVYSKYGNNFVKTILRLAKDRDNLNVIYDQIGTPTYAKDLASTILEILPKISNIDIEIYNFSNEGVVSWFDFAKEIVKMSKIKCEINPIESKDYPTKVDRPYYSVLNKSKIKETFDIISPYWKDGLDNCLKELGERK